MHLYVVSHKQFKCPNINGYIPIQVGRKFTNTNLGFLSDDTGDNISDKNNTYCELTALYWMWKNDDSKPDEIVGLCHYRRYFTKSMYSKSYKFYPDAADIETDLKHYDLILPKKVLLKSSVAEKYSLTGSGFQKDLDMLRDVVDKKYHDYISDYDSVMDGKEQYFWNMFLCRKEIMNQYCEWLFDILGDLERRTDLTGYNKQQTRIYGFLSERLLNVWIKHMNLDIKEYFVVNTDQSTLARLKFNIGVYLKIRKK